VLEAQIYIEEGGQSKDWTSRPAVFAGKQRLVSIAPGSLVALVHSETRGKNIIVIRVCARNHWCPKKASKFGSQLVEVKFEEKIVSVLIVAQRSKLSHNCVKKFPLIILGRLSSGPNLAARGMLASDEGRGGGVDRCLVVRLSTSSSVLFVHNTLSHERCFGPQFKLTWLVFSRLCWLQLGAISFVCRSLLLACNALVVHLQVLLSARARVPENGVRGQ